MDNYQKKILLLCVLLFGCVLTSIAAEYLTSNDEPINLPPPQFVDTKVVNKTSNTQMIVGETAKDYQDGNSTFKNRKEKSAPKLQNIAQTININTATEAELDTLPGIGPAIAKRIVDYRKEQTFSKIEDIMLVKGIGKKKFAKMREMITVE